MRFLSISLPSLKSLSKVSNKPQDRMSQILSTISAVKSQLRFHATLIQKHSPTFLFFLERFEPSHPRQHWAKFQPYSVHHLQILVNVFGRALVEVERDESVLMKHLDAGVVKNGLWKAVFGNKDVEEVMMRWEIEVRSRRVGRLILDSWGHEEEDGWLNKEERPTSCSIPEVMEMLAALWEEEVERDYLGCFPEEVEKDEYWEDGYEWEEEEETACYEMEGEDSIWDDTYVQEEAAVEAYSGPKCLKRKNGLTLQFTDDS
ncbi:hypothetical protein ABW20_dc0104664 [Dactylellina cionopaga]|nr:hypothetical protein ABW20_dc0104664 [Dactylellina cionopaga]